LSLSSQSSRSCAGLKIKVLKDKGLEFANSIRAVSGGSAGPKTCAVSFYSSMLID